VHIELIADGLKFPEGPVAMGDGSVVLVEIATERLTQIFPDGRKEVLAEIPGGPNGCALGPDGAFYVCNNGGQFDYIEVDGILRPAGEPSSRYRGGSIDRVDPVSGNVTTIWDSYNGERLLSPNDLVFDQQGGLWFTDYGFRRGGTLHLGAVYYGKPDGGRLARARKNLLSPNGIGLSPMEDQLYIADTLTARLYRCAIESPGKLARSHAVPGSVMVTLPGDQGFDSLAVEEGGKLCVATLFNGGISTVDADGAVEHVAFPDPLTTNICFGGEDMRDAWVTCAGTGTLYKCRWPRPGLRLNFSR
jgi:gluconolactonase